MQLGQQTNKHLSQRRCNAPAAAAASKLLDQSWAGYLAVFPCIPLAHPACLALPPRRVRVFASVHGHMNDTTSSVDPRATASTRRRVGDGSPRRRGVERGPAAPSAPAPSPSRPAKAQSTSRSPRRDMDEVFAVYMDAIMSARPPKGPARPKSGGVQPHRRVVDRAVEALQGTGSAPAGAYRRRGSVQ